MNSKFDKFLNNIETQNNVSILFCVEQSSRLWGYNSPTSDHDLLFVFVKNTKRQSLFDQHKTSSLEFHFELDDGTPVTIRGWSLQKALQLASKSNGLLLEACLALNKENSKFVYRNNEKFSVRLTEYYKKYSSRYTLGKSFLSCLHHQLNDFQKVGNVKSLLAAAKYLTLYSLLNIFKSYDFCLQSEYYVEVLGSSLETLVYCRTSGKNSDTTEQNSAYEFLSKQLKELDKKVENFKSYNEDTNLELLEDLYNDYLDFSN